MKTLFKSGAKFAAESFLLRKGKDLWTKNKENWNYPLTKFDKLITGLHLVLKDYAEDKFPPTFDDQQQAYENEIAYRHSLPGMPAEAISEVDMRKPFWYGKSGHKYLKDFVDLSKLLEAVNVPPPARLLELGCGSGWMAEFLSLMGYHVTGTTLSPYDAEDAARRVESIRTKKIHPSLEFVVAPMESVKDCLPADSTYDCVFVYEALHHAYDWKTALQSAYACLNDQGWLLLCNEPNEIHTMVSYRVALLSNTHEIGFKKKEVISQLRAIGFKTVTVVKGKLGLKIRPLWIAAQKEGGLSSGRAGCGYLDSLRGAHLSTARRQRTG